MISTLKNFFQKDYFAMDLLGITIEKAENGVCECLLKKRKELLNANGVMQGGALYTLGDFAFAVASASSGKMSVTSSLTVNYIKPGKGELFRAIATPVNIGKKISYYDVTVYDGEIVVAKMSVVGCVIGETSDFIKDFKV
ncbi:MAG: PaaI family thioesterase [Clostridia bacterium]|nr:PaaI family thioesterase [Clostridia bacterium]